MSEAKLIPAEHANIYWNEESPYRHAGGPEVLVLDQRETSGRGYRHGDPSHLDSSTGAMGSGWTTSGHPLDNPTGVFAHYWLAKGSSPVSIHAALSEFAKIEECQWARDMLAAFDWAAKRQMGDADE